MIEIGSCRAVMNKIQTTTDGSLRLTLDLFPQDRQMVAALLERFAINEKLLEIGIVAIDREDLNKLD